MPVKLTKWEETFDKELDRLGCGYESVGPCESFAIMEVGDCLHLADDWAGVDIPKSKLDSLLKEMKALPDDIGTYEVWELLKKYDPQ